MKTGTYCLFCIAGQEDKIISQMKKKGYKTLAPTVMRWKPKSGGDKGLQKKACKLLPGYIFFEDEDDIEPDWRDVREIPSVVRILQYSDGERAMRGVDAEFVAWLKKYDGVIKITKVVKVGTKIEFVDGPLKDMSGRIIKVNKNRKQVQVDIGEEGSMIRAIWCSIEYIEANVGAENL